MTYTVTSKDSETRISKVHAKAKAVRFFYFLGTLLLAVAAFFPILYGTSVGDMSVLNFWRPFLDLTNYKTSLLITRRRRSPFCSTAACRGCMRSCC